MMRITGMGLRLWLVGFAITLVVSASPTYAATLATLHQFCESGCSDGAQPSSGLVADALGNFYGVTPVGGAQNGGVVYELILNPAEQTWTYQTLYSFCSDEDKHCVASNPVGELIVDIHGDLYGVTGNSAHFGTGTAYKLSPPQNGGAWTLTVLHKFRPQNAKRRDGNYPESGLTYAGATSGALYDGESALYGTTAAGGSHFGGTLYRLEPQTRHGQTVWVETFLYNFCADLQCEDGEHPSATPLLDAAGNLVGTSYEGGVNGQGSVYELMANGSFQTLYSFCSQLKCSDGANPDSPVVMDSAGNLFGAASAGGQVCRFSPGCGAIYKLSNTGGAWSESVLYAFCQQQNCADGQTPQGGIAMDSAGNVFGTTVNGGSGYADIWGSGIVFELKGTKFKVLHTFCPDQTCSDEGHPQAKVLLGADDAVYGTTNFSTVPEWQWGTVFRLTR